MKKYRALFPIVLISVCLFVFAPRRAHGESNCSGPTYTNSNCNSQCPQANCLDVSFNQDGTLFQCCGTFTPEFDGAWGPILMLALALAGLGWMRRRQSKARAKA